MMMMMMMMKLCTIMSLFRWLWSFVDVIMFWCYSTFDHFMVLSCFIIRDHHHYLLLFDWPCSLEWFSNSAMTLKLPPSWGMMLRHQVHLIMSNYSTHHGLQVYPLLVSVNPFEHSSKFSIKYTVHVDTFTSSAVVVAIYLETFPSKLMNCTAVTFVEVYSFACTSFSGCGRIGKQHRDGCMGGSQSWNGSIDWSRHDHDGILESDDWDKILW